MAGVGEGIGSILNSRTQVSVKKCELHIKKTISTYGWLHQLGDESENIPSVLKVDEEVNDSHNEYPMVEIDNHNRIDPKLANLGSWEIEQEYPQKLSG